MNINKLAIVIPAYKPTFFASALDSIAAQTCKNFTLYIGDDCSPFDLKSIVDKYSDKISLVYHRFDTNLGGTDLVAQWKRCIDMTQGEEWIWLFSDDDIMEEKCVEEFYDLSDEIKNNYIIHFDIKQINEFNNGELTVQPRFPKIMNDFEFISNKVKGNINSFVVEYIFPRYVYEKANGFQNFDLAWGTDILTWMKFAGCCNGIYTINKTNAYVRWRKSSENISPCEIRPILLRKHHAIIANAAFVQKYLVEKGYGRNFFIHGKQVLTSIVKNSNKLSLNECSQLFDEFENKVGFKNWTKIFRFLSLINRLLKIW